MSNLRPSRTAPTFGRHPAAERFIACAVLGLLACVWGALFGGRARADANPFEAWANMIAYTEARYHGPVLPFPAAPPRPANGGTVNQRTPVPKLDTWPSAVATGRAGI